MRPSLENLPKSIAALDPRKQRLLALLLKEEGIDPLRAPIVPVAREAGAFPLSFAQERLWFIEQLQPGNIAYNLPNPLRVKGPLDPGVLARTFAEIARRHETLRTTFALGPTGRPVQVVAPPGPVPLPFVDLAALPAARREEEARRLATEDSVRPFDLARGPVLRLALLRLGEADHAVLATMHHIASDGWSSGILVREVMAIYAAFSAGVPSPLPELPIQYVDFASWQRQTLQGAVLERELAYWRRRLGGPDGGPAVLAIPTDRPRPAVAGFLGGIERGLVAEGEGVERTKALARESGATLFMLVLAAFEALLARYTGQTDVTVGTPVANRQRTETEDLIGFFVNTLVLRGDLGGDPSFRELLARARRVATEAFSHQDLPFSKLVEELNPERSLAHSPFFQVTCSVANLPVPNLSISGLAFEPVVSDQATATFDLNLTVVDMGTVLVASLEHRADLFDATTVRRMLGHVGTLLAAAVDDPDRRLSALPLLTPAERQELVEWNDTAAAYAGAGTLHGLVAAQVERTPDAVAVTAGGDALSYRELDRRAAALARRLAALGVGPDVPVAVLMERSREMMVALLGVLAAGGAYLPLDPAHPAERLAAALADAAGGGPAIVLTQERFVALAPQGATVLALDIGLGGEPDRDRGRDLGRDASPLPASGPDHLAYVIFTSGSTGRPKGAMNTHWAIVNRLLWMQAAYGLTAADRVLQKTPFTFDVSVWEFFWPLLAGARLVMAEPGGHADPAYLLRTIEAEGVTTLHFVPSMLAAFLSEVGPGTAARCPSLRRVMASGEALPFALTRRFFARGGLAAGAELHNLYGPTEAAVDVTAWACERDPTAPLVPIGRPVANTAIHLLDADLRPVPVGVAGELYIAGVQPARGYVGRPDLTAERFVPDPFAASPGARAYRTGDLARRLPGGEVDYLGRLDHQVKIRGLRIELGEIEAEMARFPGVAEAVVVTAPGAGGDPRLVAFAVPDARRAAPVARRLRLEAAGELAGRELAELPNGLVVAQRNRGETEFLFREIFGERVYLRHGVALGAGAVVFDVGANIGLFSLFARRAGAARIYAFEPIPEVFADLRANARLHDLPIHLFDCGLADEAGTAEFTYYPHATLLSGRFGDAAEERGVVRELLKAQGAALGERELAELLAERVRPERVTCRLRTLSEVMRAERVERIDLLKVDVEKSELSVLQGIEPADWPKVRQVVVEVRDSGGRLAEVTGLLAAHGFAVEVEQDRAIASAGLYNVYARRPRLPRLPDDAPPAAVEAPARPEGWASPDGWASPEALLRDLRAALARRLPEHMIPGAVVLVDALPTNANGKADRKALAARAARAAAQRPEAARAGAADAARLAEAAPRTAMEELIAAQWAELLGLERVPRDASFFDLGGHSLLATQALSRLRQEPGVDLPLRALFAAPTVAGLAAAVEAELGSRPAGEEGAVRPPLRPAQALRSGGGRLPLSFAQERLWFIDQMAPGSAAYNVSSGIRLAGRLALPALAATFAEIVRRHETLRTRFATDAQGPVQIVLPPAPLPLPRIDLRALPPPRREAELAALAVAEGARPFDLAAGPLLRVTLVVLAAEEHAALFTMHHIASDAWSIGVLVRELAALYPAFLSGRPSPLPPLPVQYADFAAWQRGWLAGETLGGEIAYWREALAGAPTVLDLPADHPRPAVQTARGAVERFILPAAATAAARRLARESGSTVFMVALAAFDALLHRLTGQPSLLVGSTIANRTLREIEGLIGFFVNTLALRSDLETRESFQRLLDRTRERTLAAYGHQDIPFERLVELMVPERDLSRPPLVQVLLQLQNAPVAALDLPGLTLSPLATGTEAAKFDLMVNLVERGDRIGGQWLYNADLFDATTVRRWVEAYGRLLAAAVESPTTTVARLPLLSPAERHQLLAEWGGASARFAVEGTHPATSGARAAAASAATAVVCGGERLSYGDLETRANRLANHLLGSGVAPGSLVGLCLERSLDLPAAILGVLKAGCAYVPLDPDYPAERLAFLLADSRAAALVTRADLLPRLPDPSAEPHPPLVLLDADAEEIARRSAAAPRLPSSPRDLAYVIYTSGSTGRPKGVLVEHGHVLRLFAATEGWFGFGAGDVWTLFHSYTFDFSVWEIWGALLHGGRLVVVPYAVSRSPADFRALLARERATVLSQTPSAFRQLVWADEAAPGSDLADLDDLRLVVFGGEALEPASLAPWLARHGEARPRLVNMYGITETTVHVTYRVMGRADLGSAASPIGRPLPDLSVYVVDAGLEPLPVGVPGEMLVGGAGVARGYLGRPELTAERFVPHPFGGEGGELGARGRSGGELGARGRSGGELGARGRSGGELGARLYRSGDLARWLPTGELAYLGRIDQQVKVRGFRVELGEIQAALAAHPAVREAAVLARKEEDGEHRLVAYLAVDGSAAVSAPGAAELRSFLAATLPEHMLPAAFVTLPSLPLTPHGKVDRRALADVAPEGAATRAGAGYEAPRDELERFLAGLFREVLKVDRVGAHDGFFELGGNSIAGAVLVNRLQQQLGETVQVVAIFNAPTVARLADHLRREHPRAVARLWGEAAPAADQAELGSRPALGRRAVRPPLRPAHALRSGGRLPLSFAQERLWFIDQMAPGSATYNVPSAVRLAGRLALPALAATFAEIVRRHETLRTRFATDAQGPVQIVLPPAPLPLPQVDLRALLPARREAELAALAVAEGARPFDLAAGPMLRVTLVDLAAEDHAALFTMHHIASDAWSMGVLVEELAALYPAFLSGRPSPLPPLPVQYADFAAWQRGWLAGETLEGEIAYWREALAGAPIVLDLPADRPRPAVQTARGAVEPFLLPAAVTAGVRRLARESGSTIFMVALAAFDALLHRMTGQTSLLVGSTIANRTLREIEGLIGFFVNTLALRSDLETGESFRRLLDRTRERALAAYEHQDIPFERLVELMVPERDPSRPPLVQVLLQLQNAPVAALDLPGLALSPLATGAEAAKFDLVVNLVEGGDEVGGQWLYSADLFDATTVRRWVEAYGRLLAAAVESPAGEVARLPLLSPAERHQLLAEWGGASAGFAVEGSLHATFAARAAAAPAATAVVCGGERLSYGDLEARANRLANHLLARGVAPGSLVGLCLERSLDLPAAILGVLKAGCAYVPLDPDYPAERLAFLLADSRAAALVTRADLLPRLPDPSAEPHPPLVLLDADAEEIVRRSAAAPRLPSSPRDLAYVIYTSGSTGRPKGVLVEHGHVLRLFAATDGWFGFGSDDVWTLFHSYAFDFSVWEIWGALLYGGRLVVVPYAVSRSPADFRALLARERATVLSQTPSAFRQLVWADEAAGGVGLDNLRLVVFGGEALEPSSLAPWLARHGEARPCLVNMYGITETTVHVTYRVMGRADLGSAASPIGRPIPDLSVYVVDAGFEPLPVGVPGEMLVGGAGVARGYLGRPELTAERFVPDPFGGASRGRSGGELGARGRLGGELGARLYRSGDLARWLPTGELAYLGRIDQQVKVRGFRVELGEIQAALAAHPAVREAAVLARKEADGEHRLVAYLAVDGSAAVSAPGAAELRSFLAATLPEHMLPAAFVTLPSLPLTPHGKVDRRALAEVAPEGAATRAGAGYEAPRDELERFLAGLFQEVLKVERVGLHDGFFELGGNSIAGAVLVNRLQQELGEIVQVVVIFDAPTVAQLADHLRREHPRAVARLWGEAAAAPAPGVGETAGEAAAAGRVDAAKAEELRRVIRSGRPLARAPISEPKNPRALFVLAPPRSGTTLLRVMLGGHPRLFAPPELELLSFATLAERRAAFGGGDGRDSFWLEGAIRAVMEAKGLSVEAARELVEAGERAGWSTGRLYAEIQSSLGGRMLVDKTPSYAIDPAILARAEEGFEAPLYVHLVRHPYGMIHSFEEAKLDQLFFRHPHRFARRELAELIWLVSQENILAFLAGVPAARRHRVVFEELVARPEAVLRELSAFLGLDYRPEMADPYLAGSARMTDGLHAASRMLGDVKFHQHRGVDAAAAGRWREAYREGFLGAPTRALAARLGYDVGPAPESPESPESREAPEPGGALAPAARRPGAPAPLSFAQERLWFLDRLDPGTPTYNIPTAVRFGGRFDLPAFAAAVAEIARRHDALRTTFALAPLDGEPQPVQVVAPPAPRPLAPLSIVDLTALGAAWREAEMRRLADEEAARPFDLERGPLLRVSVVELAEAERVMLLTMHHIVSDGWSMDVLTAEITALYGAFAMRRPSPLRPLPIQYTDFAVWQRSWLQGRELERQIDFWKETLQGAAVLDLPTDLPRPPVQTFRGGTLQRLLPRDLRDALLGLAERTGATLFMGLLAGLAALLGRLSGQEDVSIGFPIANRTRRETEGLIGFFANTLVLRADLSGDPGFRGLLARVRDAAKGAYAHQDLPFERVVEVLQPARDRSRTPLFQVMLTLKSQSARPAASAEGTLPQLHLEAIPVETEAVKFDLTLSTDDGPRGVRLALSYRRDLFLPATIERMLRQYETLLAGAVADPAAPLSALPLLGDAERRQLAEWGSGGPYAAPRAGALQDGFFAWAAAHPEDEALAWGEERVSYGELAARASRLARRLIELGAGPETLVGVCLPRSPELVAALLAVLAAGAAYLPLDPAYPVERLGFMLEDTRAPLVLTAGLESSGGPDLASLPGAGERRVVDLADLGERKAIARQSGSPPPRRTAPGNLAYVLYTSGSTGRPKGVAIEHRSVLALFAWAAPVFSQDIGIGAGARNPGAISAGTSISFDVSVFEILFTLAHGGRMLLLENSLALAAHPARGELTLLNAVPSAVAELLRQGAIPPSVRTVNLPGEPLSGKLVDALYATGHVERVFNLYGPSEDTTYSTYALVPASIPTMRASEPSIGRPIAGTTAHLLDRHRRPVPPGVVGEVYLGGAGLARGYFARPELTAERFVPHPESTEPGARLYRTGDLARYRTPGDQAGELEYLGRADRQVKLRGFRIELGEIEAVLAAQPEVEEVAVVLREGSSGGPELAAFYTARPVPGNLSGDPAGDLSGDRAVDLAPQLRSALRARLPEYMIPAAFVPLPALPLSPNGKVDRQALARRSAAPGSAAEGDRLAPRGAVEIALARIWEDLLGRRVGAGDSFFELGGHSLLATRLLSRLRDTFGVELTLHRLFERPVLADLAGAVEEELARTGAALPGRAISLAAERPGEPVPLSFAQERLWFLDRLDPGTPTYNLPNAIRFVGAFDLPAFAAAVGEIVRRHGALRTTFALVDGEPMQVVAPPPPWPRSLSLPIADLSALPAERREAEMRRLAAEEAARPFDLARGPLLRVSVVTLGETERAMLLTMHHIVSDGWSMEVLTAEVAALYGAFARRRPSPLPPLPIQYADFALWQRSWLQGAELARQVAFWKETLQGAAVLDLPTDLPRPPVQTFRGGALQQPLPGALRDALSVLAERSGATLFMAYLAGFAALLGRLTGQEDVSIGFPIANRTRAETEGLIGFFSNTLVLRADLSGDPGFDALLARVRDAARRAYDHQDLPFERVVEVLQPARDRSRTPLFQAMLVLQGPGGRPAVSGAAAGAAPGAASEAAAGAAGPAFSRPDMRRIAVDNDSVKFDLMLTVDEGTMGTRLALAYRRDLFLPATIESMLRRYERLLAGAVADPAAPLSALPLLDDAERRQLAEWGSGGPYAAPRAGALQDGFFAWAAAHPGDEALAWGEERVSYGELAARASRLARRLIELEAGPETLVGVCLPRSPELVAALLAVLAAGAAYLPLDPAYPVERLGFMLEDTRAPLVLAAGLESSGGPDLASLPGAAERRVIDLSDPAEREAIARQSGSPPPRRTVPGNLAYVLYTSGSTGRPKGVAIEHRSVLALFAWAAPVFSPDIGIGAKAGTPGAISAGTSISFDVSVFEILFTLAHGGWMLLLENSLALPAHPARGELTLLNAVPSAVAELLRQGAIPPSVRTVNLPGEPLSGKLVDALYATGHVERVFNLYGPSEDTTYSTYALVPPERTSEPSIGRPIAGTTAHLLDRHRRPVPPGVVGEVCLGGAGLARGYFARPELTAERFVPHPESTEPGARLYRTGDLARYRPDGELEYLGRADRQVKLRGFRIELGEVEAVLAAQPEVEEAAVVLREGSSGGPELAAFYTARPVPGDLAGDLSGDRAGDLAPRLRSALRARLPEHMIPAAFVPLPALPLSPNGKVDRRALARLSSMPAAAAGARVEPRGAVEIALARIWEDLLGRPVSAGDSFFEVGGHSLLATRLLSRLRDAFGVELTLHRLFERPVLADLASELSLAGAEDRALAAARPAALGILPAPPGRDLPLSFAQERLWFLDRLDPGSPTYNIPTAVRFGGDLDLAVLAAALDELARRHASLRTTFALARTGAELAPVQVIAPPSRRPRPLPVADLSGLPPARREAEAHRLAAEEAARPFDLERGPLLRTAVLSLGRGAGGRIVLLTMHHIVSDGWSMEVLTRELSALYGAFALGLPSPLPPLPIQYADFALWQRSWLQGEVLARQIDFWKETLGGAATLDLPTDLPRPPLQTYRGLSRGEAMPCGLRSALASLAERSRATPFMAYLAGFAALLGRLADQEDVSIGFPIANRTRSELEGLIGFFANTLVLRADLSGDPGFGELLARVREAAKGAYAHQDIPFEKVVEVLQPARDRSRTPLFQAMFTFEGGGGARAAAEPEAGPALDDRSSDGAPEPLAVAGGSVKFDLTLSVDERGEEAALAVAARTDLFFPTTIARLIRQYQALLAAALADPARPVAELPLLTAPERQQALCEWSTIDEARRPGESLPELLSAAAAATPQATAVVAADGELTFAALERRVSRLAARLAALGVGPEVAVGVALSRSTAWLTALLAAMRAGGVYVPLDPGYPRERLAFLLADSGAGLLVTSRAHAAALPDLLPRTLFLDEAELAALDASGPAIPAMPATPAIRERPAADRADALAYLIYTSGSTGRPKGVAVSHRGIGNLAAALVAEHAMTAADRVLQFASPSFDVSLSEVAMALAAGAALHLAPAAELMPGPALDRLLRERRITVTFLPPSALGAMPDPDLPDLRALLVGGEPCPLPWAERWARGRRLWNAYGPTEGTVYETLGELLPGDRAFALGRPLAGTRAYLLDRRLQPVPAGVPGHLHIGGVGLARGYFRRPELTAEAFVPDPFAAAAPGERLYRTGDLARFLPDGRLEFLGRIDAQVKVRGFRVEPGEVEAALLRHPAVREAVVMARSDGGLRGPMGELVAKRLVAYVVPAAGQPPAPPARSADLPDMPGADLPPPAPSADLSDMPSADLPDALRVDLSGALRAHLEAALPPHLLPSAIVVLAELPKNAAGKVDRRALPAPERPRPPGDGAQAADAAPRTPLERALAEPWAEVLGLAPASIGRDDDFFALGGTSLQGALLLRAVEERLGVPVPVAALFEAPTVAGLARLLAARHPELAAPGEPAKPEGAAPERAALGEPATPARPESVAHEKGAFGERAKPEGAAHENAALGEPALPARPESAAHEDGAVGEPSKLERPAGDRSAPVEPAPRPAAASSRLLVAIQREGTGAPFFCVHPVGGNVLCYTDLARQLGAGRRFYGLQAAGLAGSEPQRTIEEMAATYLAAVAAVQPRGPYLLGGWSLGGVIAYEMAQQATRRGERVDLVALIDSATPEAAGFLESGDEMGEMDEGELAGRLVLDLAGLSGADVERAAAELMALPPDERLEAALGYARRAGALPPQLSAEQAASMARQLTAVFAANLGALRAYRPAPYAGRVVLFRATERPVELDPAMGWRGLLDGHLEVQPLPGDHYSLLQGPGAAALAAALARALAPYR